MKQLLLSYSGYKRYQRKVSLLCKKSISMSKMPIQDNTPVCPWACHMLLALHGFLPTSGSVLLVGNLTEAGTSTSMILGVHFWASKYTLCGTSYINFSYNCCHKGITAKAENSHVQIHRCLWTQVPKSFSYLPTRKCVTLVYLVISLLSTQYAFESTNSISFNIFCRKWNSEGRLVVSDSLGPHGLYSLWNSPVQNTGVGSLSLLQGIFPTQGSNSGLLHCRRILYQLRHRKCSINMLLQINGIEWCVKPRIIYCFEVF